MRRSMFVVSSYPKVQLQTLYLWLAYLQSPIRAPLYAVSCRRIVTIVILCVFILVIYLMIVLH